MKANIAVDISPPIPYLPKFWVSVYGQNAVNQSLEKHGGWSWFFAPADKH